MNQKRIFLMSCTLLFAALSFGVFAEGEKKTGEKKKWNSHTVRRVEGWSVHVDDRLLTEEKALGDKALKVLANQLYGIEIVVPAGAVAKLREVPIWMDLDHELTSMQYHPSVEWLRKNGHDPAMAKAVHIPNVRRFLSLLEKHQQPSVVIHELAHAYHDQVLNFNNPKILAAYRQAVKDGQYKSVLHNSGKKKSHYALTDQKEYFAEATEAYFGENDFYPFVRPELKEHDPKLYEILEEVWGLRKIVPKQSDGGAEKKKALASVKAKEEALGTLIIDVRTAKEYGRGCVKGALNIPYDEIGEKIGVHAKSKDRKIVLYCLSGARAGVALRTLKGLGYKNVLNAGGYADAKKLLE